MRSLLVLLLSILLVPALLAGPKALKTVDDYRNSEEFQIGKMIKQIQVALNAPERPGSLKTIVKYGQDTRYYVMIRGWLSEELRNIESQIPGVRDPKRKQKFLAKQKLLKSAIRGIDLE